MADTKWTPGGWSLDISRSVSGNNGFHLYLTDNTGRKIAALWGKQEEKEANGLLISAAPDLFDALEEMLDAYLAGCDTPGEWEVSFARAALAKARGEG